MPSAGHGPSPTRSLCPGEVLATRAWGALPAGPSALEPVPAPTLGARHHMCHPAPAVPGVSEPRACQPAVSSLSLQVQGRRSLSVPLHSRPALQTEAVPRHADCSWASQPALSWGVPRECMGLVVLIVTACSVQSLSCVQLFATP